MNSHPADPHAVLPLVLVVDDDQDTREMYELFLNMSGYRVLTASDVETAFELALAHVPAIVVTDFMLVGSRKGTDLCRLLKQDHRTEHIPALLVTGSSRRGDAEAALGAGCADIRVKPYPLDDLLIDVRALTSRGAGDAVARIL
jgi:DNA-binding response OmpR family regulator